MAFTTRQISRVVIRNEWITVADGTFEVEELEVTDQDGNPLHDPLDVWAFRFRTDQGDEYCGPLSVIEIFKMKDVA